MVTAPLVSLLVFVTSVSGAGVPPSHSRPADPSPVHVYVQIQTSHFTPDEPTSDVGDLKGSVTDLEKALKSRKKTFAVVETPDQADLTIQIESRTTTVPRLVIAPAAPLAGQPGMPGMQDAATPTRVLHLRVLATYRGTSLEFTNKNQPIDQGGGWKSAAEDVAKQLEKWVRTPGGR